MNNLSFILLYLDPGTGSLLIQFIIAAVAGVGYNISTVRDKFSRIYKKMRKTKNI
jgi:hypothetical protein